MTNHEVRELIEDGELHFIEDALFKLNLDASAHRETVKQAEQQLNVAKNVLNSVLNEINEIHETIGEQLVLMNLEQLGNFKLVKNPPKIIVDENAKLPEQFLRIKTEADKNKIKAWLKKHPKQKIVGVSVEQTRKVVMK